MTKQRPFFNIQTIVESRYPIFLASVFKKCIQARAEDYYERQKDAIDLFESLVRFLCIVMLQEARTCVPDLNKYIVDNALEFIKRPMLGQWISLLRVLCRMNVSEKDLFWIPAISAWYNESKNKQNREILFRLAEIEVAKANKKSDTPNAAILDALVTYRNQYAHSPKMSRDIVEDHLLIIEEVLSYILESIVCLSEMEALHLRSVSKNKNGSWRLEGTKLTGINSTVVEVDSTDEMEPEEVYLVKLDSDKIECTPIPLSPFFLWHESLKNKGRFDAYHYTGAKRSYVEYHSPDSGELYHSKELHAGFKDLITLKRECSVEEEHIQFLPADERADHASLCIRRAWLYIERDQLEDALIVLEEAVLYERTLETLALMAAIQYKLRDPIEQVRTSIQECLDLINEDKVDTKNKTIQKISNELFALAKKIDSDEQCTQNDWDFILVKSRTDTLSVVHMLTPPNIRRLALPLWVGLILLWYCTSFAVDVGIYKEAFRGTLTIALCLNALIYCTGIYFSPIVIRSIKSSLSLQLDAMRLDRFEEEFYTPMTQWMFGRFITKENQLLFWESLKKEKLYYIGMALYPLVFIPTFITMNMHTLPLFMICKRIVDFTFVAVFMYPCIRYALGVTLFIFKYSRLSLKPMLTRISEDGFRCIGFLVTLNLVFASGIFVTYWPAAALMVEPDLPLYYDLPSFLGCQLFYAIVSIGVPYAIYRAARASKSKVIRSYVQHIEDALKMFVNDPSEDTRDRYKWMIENQKTIKNMCIWPLSWQQTLFVVIGGNLVLVGVCIFFVMCRLGEFPDLPLYLSNLFSFVQ